MYNYNYLKHEVADVTSWLKQHQLTDPNHIDKAKLYNRLWIENSVTGNGRGFYTSRYQAEQNLVGNHDLLTKEIGETGFCSRTITPEKADMVIRCYLLDQAILEAVKRLAE